MKKFLILMLALAMLASFALVSCSSKDGLDPSADSTAPEDFEGEYVVEMKVKDYGTITFELDSDSAPITVENFVNLARDEFYDGLTFHRIIEGFMMQGGASTDKEVKEIEGEFLSNGVNNKLKHTRGAVSMARTSIPNSATSQFFIVQQESPHLDGEYACFGYVTSGMNVVDAICKGRNGILPASEQPVIEYVRVTEK